MQVGMRVSLMIPFILFLGLVYILWGGLSLNPVYTPPKEFKEVNLAQTPITEYIFSTSIESDKFQRLLKSFRCVTCQNQSVADSTAPMALSMREAIYTQLKAGHSEKEIQDFLVSRYGDFVLYNPPFKIETFILWLGPCVFLVIGLVIGLGFAVNRSMNRSIG